MGTQARRCESAAAAVAVECRGCPERRNRRRCLVAGLDRAHADDANGAKLLGWVGDETPWQLGAVFASTKILADKPLVTKLLSALIRADREYHDVILAAVADGKAPINDKTKPLLEMIAE